jgi:hypothetical protein
VSWDVILRLLGPGLHWGKSQTQIQAAIRYAEQLGEADAAEHLRIILRLRNVVAMEQEEKTPAPVATEGGGQKPSA